MYQIARDAIITKDKIVHGAMTTLILIMRMTAVTTNELVLRIH